MTSQPGLNEYREMETTLESPSPWLKESIRSLLRSRAVVPAEVGVEATIFAKIESSIAAPSVVKVVKWSASDLYGFAEAPIIDLLNYFGDLLRCCLKIQGATNEIEFESETVELWSKVHGLNRFLSISSGYDELISTFCLLPSDSLGVLDQRKVAALTKILARLETQLGLTDNILDEIEDELENAGFDLRAPMNYDPGE